VLVAGPEVLVLASESPLVVVTMVVVVGALAVVVVPSAPPRQAARTAMGSRNSIAGRATRIRPG
jgi:hypothetical protein